MKKTLILFCLFLQTWMAGAEGYYCKHIGIDDGLSLSSVTCVAYDGKGSLWIGTRYGLNKYSNGRLQDFRDNENGSIRGSYIYFLHLDSRGCLWTSTDKGIFRYDPATDTFQCIGDTLATCAVDGTDGIWFGTHFGLKYYAYGADALSGEDSDSYTDYQTLFFHEDAFYSLDRREGLFRSDGSQSEKIEVPLLSGNVVMASALDGDILYLSLRNYGLIAYDLSTRSLVFSLRSGENDFPDEPLLALMTKDGELWMGFDGAGVKILDLNSLRIKSLDGISGGRIPLSVTSLYADPKGNVWIGSVRSGIVGLKESPIKTFSLTDVDPTAEDVVIALYASSDNCLYLGTDGSGICRYTPSSGLAFLGGNSGLKVTSIVDFDADNLLLATYNCGLYLLHRKSGRLRPFTLVDEKTNQEECFNSNAPFLYGLGNGRLLIHAVHSYLYDVKSGKFRLFTDETGDDGLELLTIGPSGDGRYYAYSSAGLFIIDIGALTISRLYSSDVSTGSVNSAVFHDGLIWFGTNYGLFSFDPLSGEVVKTDSGIFSRVSRLQSGGPGNLWIAADNQLFLSRDGRIEIVGENRGVPANEMLSSTGMPDGTVYFGGTSGLVELGTDCQFGVDEDKRVEIRDGTPSYIKLPHNYRSLIIHVNLAGADPFERILYRYRLSGPSQLTLETFEDGISLPALKAGHYRLDVSYLKSDGTWSTPQEVAEIKVRLPWYASTLMIAVYALLAFLLIAFLIDRISRNRIRALEARLKEQDSVFTAKVSSYIDEHLSDPLLNVSTVAEDLAMSRSALYYKMNASFGKGVAELIEEKRMEKAEELLRTTSLSILEISEKVGYSTPRYFSTRFKFLHNGQTPLNFRHSVRKEN